MTSKILGRIDVCTDCIHVHANGECDPFRPEDLPDPLCLIVAPLSVTMGLAVDEHSEHCTATDREEGCDCEHTTFSTYQCEGCGDDHHGERYALTLWSDEA